MFSFIRQMSPPAGFWDNVRSNVIFGGIYSATPNNKEINTHCLRFDGVKSDKRQKLSFPHWCHLDTILDLRARAYFVRQSRRVFFFQ